MIKKIFKKLNITNVDDFKAFIWQFIKFGLVGVSNTVVLYVTYYVLIKFNVQYIIANTIAYFVSVINAYIWNAKLVFKQSNNAKEKEKAKSAAKLFVSYTFTLFLGTILLYVWVDILGISKVIGPIINFPITIPINFFLNKLWAFKDKKVINIEQDIEYN